MEGSVRALQGREGRDTTRPARLRVEAITTHIPHLLFAEHFRTKIFLFNPISLLSNINISIYRIFQYKTYELLPYLYIMMVLQTRSREDIHFNLATLRMGHAVPDVWYQGGTLVQS